MRIGDFDAYEIGRRSKVLSSPELVTTFLVNISIVTQYMLVIGICYHGSKVFAIDINKLASYFKKQSSRTWYLWSPNPELCLFWRGKHTISSKTKVQSVSPPPEFFLYVYPFEYLLRPVSVFSSIQNIVTSTKILKVLARKIIRTVLQGNGESVGPPWLFFINKDAYNAFQGLLMSLCHCEKLWNKSEIMLGLFLRKMSDQGVLSQIVFFNKDAWECQYCLFLI